jgi:hypothetical protein
MEHQWNEIDRGKPTTLRKTCPSATLSTTNPTWTDPGSNAGLRSGRPATNRLSHDTALDSFFMSLRLQLSREVPADASFLSDKTAVLRNTIKRTAVLDELTETFLLFVKS